MLIKLRINPQHLNSLPWQHVKGFEVLGSEPKVKVQAPTQKLIFRKNGNTTVIDQQATLAHHKTTATEILGRRWPQGTWQHSLKRSLAKG